MRNGSPSIKIWKMDTFLEQNELNRLKMVRFKCRWHRDPCMSFNFALAASSRFIFLFRALFRAAPTYPLLLCYCLTGCSVFCLSAQLLRGSKNIVSTFRLGVRFDFDIVGILINPKAISSKTYPSRRSIFLQHFSKCLDAKVERRSRSRRPRRPTRTWTRKTSSSSRSKSKTPPKTVKFKYHVSQKLYSEYVSE